jgi:hypothetical protein
MKQVYFSHLKGDLVYQFFSFACSAYTAIQTGKKVLVIDSDLFDVEGLSKSLETKGLRVLEKKTLDYKTVAVFYGKGNHVLDLTEHVPPILLAEQKLNLIQGDPAPNKEKELFICYSLNGEEYTDTYPEIRTQPILLDVSQAMYHSDFFWLDKVNLTLYNEILKSIRVKQKATLKGNRHVIHLLSMEDIEQCAKQLYKNSVELYEVFTKKYMEIITLFITNSTDTILLVQKEENPAIEEFLKKKGNPYKRLNITEPGTFAEVTEANGILVGLFNIDKLTGSSCSYYLHHIVPYSQSILLDMENIYKN